MFKITIIIGILLILTACGNENTESVPHNRVVHENATRESVLFNFRDSNRLSRRTLSQGVSIELSSYLFGTIETDYELVIDHFDGGWKELETIDFFTRSHPYSIARNHRIRQTLFTGHFENDLEAGRYRLRLKYTSFDEEDDEPIVQTIGAVFWLED